MVVKTVTDTTKEKAIIKLCIGGRVTFLKHWNQKGDVPFIGDGLRGIADIKNL
jgi:hypothetical protein